MFWLFLVVLGKVLEEREEFRIELVSLEVEIK